MREDFCPEWQMVKWVKNPSVFVLICIQNGNPQNINFTCKLNLLWRLRFFNCVNARKNDMVDICLLWFISQAKQYRFWKFSFWKLDYSHTKERRIYWRLRLESWDSTLSFVMFCFLCLYNNKSIVIFTTYAILFEWHCICRRGDGYPYTCMLIHLNKLNTFIKSSPYDPVGKFSAHTVSLLNSASHTDTCCDVSRACCGESPIW